MGDLIQFPKRPEPENVVVEGLAPIDFTECQELIHVFDEVPGVCKCGQNTWDPADLPPVDIIGIHEVK